VDNEQRLKELERRERWVARLLAADAEQAKAARRGAQRQYPSHWDGLSQKRGVAVLGRIEHFGLLQKTSDP